jgi:WD40 repeat protein
MRRGPGRLLLAVLACGAAARAEEPVRIRLSAPANAVALSAAAGRAAIVSRDNRLTVWDLGRGELLRTIPLSSARIDVLVLSVDGRLIFAGDHAGNAQIWETETGRARFERRLPHYAAAASFSRDGQRIAIAPTGEPVEVFDVADGRLLCRTLGAPGGTVALAFSRDGASIATADADTAVRLYDAETGRLRQENREFLLEPLAIDFSADGRQVVSGGGDKAVVVIDAASGKILRRFPKTDEPVSVSCLKVSPDGALVAAILMKAENMTEAAPVVKWDATGRKRSEWTPATLALSLDWRPDGRLISAGAEGDTVVVSQVP